MESLIKLLEALIQKVPWLSEIEQEAANDLLRDVEKDQGTSVLPPKATDANQPPEPPPTPDPGPVAEPVPADEQPPVPTSPEVADQSPEATNAFSGTDPAPSA